MKKFLIYSAGLGVIAFVLWALIQIATGFDFGAFKKWFYTVTAMLVAYYVVCLLRAVTKYFEAKTRKVGGE